ncbi:MAG: hypothetical protein F4Y80_01680 [Caldilineaceae bacterium SB0665_bin_21]|nr:hypothetical protein [Caldilineaceae bacterium SB0665_bin_21]
MNNLVRFSTGWLLAVLLLWSLAPVSVRAAGSGSFACDPSLESLDRIQSREQIRAFVYCAIQTIEEQGWEAAKRAFQSDPSWLSNGIFLFAGTDDLKVDFVAGSETLLPGDDAANLQDDHGHYFVRDMYRIAGNWGEGFVYYDILDRQSGLTLPKTSFVKRLDMDGTPFLLGAGFHNPSDPANCHPERVRAEYVYSAVDTENFVDCAARLVLDKGLLALFELMVPGGRWNHGPTYVFIHELDTLTMAAHRNPELVGQDRTDRVDPDGVLITQEIRRVVQRYGDGYVYYTNVNPSTSELHRKASYVKGIELGGRWYSIGSGLYQRSAACQAAPSAHAIHHRDDIMAFVACVRDLLEERGELAFPLLTGHPQFRSSGYYAFVLNQQCRDVLYPLDYRADDSNCDLEDVEGTKIMQEFLKAGLETENQQGWTSYRWLNPATDRVERKESFVMKVSFNGEDMVVGAGIYTGE